MTAREFVSRLDHVRKASAGWTARCPAHEDRNPSLSVSERDGKILLHCFSGCEPTSIVQVLGLRVSDLFTDSRAHGDGQRIVATYDYIDESGKLLFQVLRYEPKAFKQRRPDGAGGWLWNINGTRRVLYRLPDVIASKAVVVAEGEKDVETARQLGLTATCNPHGAENWRPEYSESLRGKRVAVICDADPPGLAHGRDVARSLVGVAESVRLIEALPQSKDLTVWIEHGGTRDALLSIIREAPALTAADVAKRQHPKVEVPGVLASDVIPEGVTWLWENRIPLGKVTIFDGDPGLAKSTVALDLAARITCGTGMPDGSPAVCAPAGAVVVSLEDGVADTIVPRLKAAGAALERVRIITTIKGPDGTERTPTLPADLPEIEAATRDVNARLLVLDPLVAMLATETNSYRDQDIRRVLAPVAALAEKTGVAVICIRHLNKGGGQNPKYRGGGSIGIIGADRAAFLFGEKPGEEGRYIFAPVKGNLWRGKPSALEYSIEDRDEQPVIAWHGNSTHSAASLLAQPETAEESGAVADARSFLGEALKDGQRDSKEIMREARQAGIAERTLYRAKHQLGVRSVKVGMGSGQHWEWGLPKMASEPTKIANFENLAIFGETTETKPFNSAGSPKIAKIAKTENMTILGCEDGHLETSDAMEF